MKIQKQNVAFLAVTYEFSQMIALSGKSYSKGDFIKQCPVKMVEIVCTEKVRLFKDILLTRNTVVEQVVEMSACLKQHLKAVSMFEHVSIIINETVDITEQFAIFLRAWNSEFNIYEELIELVPIYDTTKYRTSLRELSNFCMSIVLF